MAPPYRALDADWPLAPVPRRTGVGDARKRLAWGRTPRRRFGAFCPKRASFCRFCLLLLPSHGESTPRCRCAPFRTGFVPRRALGIFDPRALRLPRRSSRPIELHKAWLYNRTRGRAVCSSRSAICTPTILSELVLNCNRKNAKATAEHVLVHSAGSSFLLRSTSIAPGTRGKAGTSYWFQHVMDREKDRPIFSGR